MPVDLPAIALPQEDVALARESGQRLATRLSAGGTLQPSLHLVPGGEAIELPPTALPHLAQLLTRLADGERAAQGELSEEEAAELLRFQASYLTGLLDQGKLPFRREGTKRRIALGDLLAYKRRSDADRVAALEELAAQAQELGMGY